MKVPSLNRVNSVLIFGLALFAVLHFARAFLIPLTAGIILSMLVLPVCQGLEARGWRRGWAVAVCLCIILLGGSLLVAVLLVPLASFNQDISQLQSSMEEKLYQGQQYLVQRLGISIQEQNAAIEQASSALSAVGEYLTGLLSGFLGLLFDLILILVYIAFFLFNREQYESFIVKLNQHNDPDEVRRTLRQVSHVSVQYLVGRLLSIVILAVLYTLGLTAIGLKHAMLMGGLAAVMTIVPYVGTTLGGAFPAATALFAGPEGAHPLAAIAVIFSVQLVDDYLLEPFIVGGKVNVSPLAIIIGIVVGGLVWGVAGMVLFIPLLGMLKIVCNHVPALHPYGYLMGAPEKPERQQARRLKRWLSRWRKKP